MRHHARGRVDVGPAAGQLRGDGAHRRLAGPGACSHELHVDQTLRLDAPGLAVTGVRIERVALTSDP